MKQSMYHPFEMAISGFSGSGKTTLIEKLINQAISKNLAPSVVKHDAHNFEVDVEGKDSFRFREAGAKSVLITNSHKHCLQTQTEVNPFAMKQVLVDSDFVLVEGHKNTKISKLVIVDDEILPLLRNAEVPNVAGLIAKTESELRSLKSEFSLPTFFRDDVETIFNFILLHFKPAPVKALVLAGGKSTRMGSDKGQLNYHGDFQTKTLTHLLQRYVDEVYVSVRSEQKDEKHISELKAIYDTYPSVGPSSGILSAFHQDPKSAWLVVAVDLPYLDEQTLEDLFAKRNPFKVATCFENPERKWPEPLCTIWEPKARLKLHQFMGMDRNCPRKILFNSDIELLKLTNSSALDNCNTPEEFEKAKDILGATQ